MVVATVTSPTDIKVVNASGREFERHRGHHNRDLTTMQAGKTRQW